jgi:hypothetical protein
MSTNTKLVCDPSGKPILFERPDDLNRCIDLTKECLDYELEYERVGTDRYGMIPDPKLCQRFLSIPERASISALAWYCREYGSGLKRGETVTLPKLVNDTYDHDAMSCAGSFKDEARAYMFAKTVESCFHFSAQVIETQFGWSVVVGNDGDSINSEDISRLQGACAVLMSFPIGDYICTFGGNVEHETYPDPIARQAWHDRHNAPLTRIESALGEILSRLDKNAATGSKTPSTATGQGKGKPKTKVVA